jgi:hypothetical protein
MSTSVERGVSLLAEARLTALLFRPFLGLHICDPIWL